MFATFAFLKVFEKEESCPNFNLIRKKVAFLQIKDRLDDILNTEVRNVLINEIFENLIQEIVGEEEVFSMCIRGDIEDVPHIHLDHMKLSDFETKPLIEWISPESLEHLYQLYLIFDVKFMN